MADYPKDIQFEALSLVWKKRVHCILSEVFNDSKNNNLKVKDKSLLADIGRARDIVEKLEKVEIEKYTKDPKTKRKVENFKPRNNVSYVQEFMYDLNLIIRKMPVRLGIDFSEYYDALPTLGEKSSERKIESIKEKMKRLKKEASFHRKLRDKRSLRNIRIYALPTTWFETSDQSSDQRLSEYFIVGLVDYLQKYINSKPYRARPCNECGKWFVSIRINHLSCCKKCLDKNYGQTEVGKKKAREASQRKRDKDKKEMKRK